MEWESDICEGEGFEIRPGFDGSEEVIGRVRYDLCYVSVLGRGYVAHGRMKDEPL